MLKGNLVQLKSGGPIMTIGWTKDGSTYCNWFDDRNELKDAVFNIDQLQTVESES